MKYLILWLEAPLQAWGFDSRFDLRNSLEFPTRSGLFGMLLAASGDSGEQVELLEKMQTVQLRVFTFRSGKKTALTESSLCDFHMVGNGYDAKDAWQTLHTPRTSDGKKAVGCGAKLTYRYYLQNKKFAAILGMPDEMAETFAHALQHPVFDLYLGRKCCVPTDMIYRGTTDSETEAVSLMKEIARSKDLFPELEIQETDVNGPEAIILYDAPVQFGAHHVYRERGVRKVPFSE